MNRKEVNEKIKALFIENKEVYKRYLWLYFLDLKYNMNLSIKEKDLSKIAYRLYFAYQKKKQRIKRMIDFIIMKCRKTGLVWFCTFTFKDEFLNIPHKSILQRFKNLEWVILNQDYGKTTHRRHYHAIIGGLNENELKEVWGDLGFTKFKLVAFNKLSYERVGAYIVKLSSHAIKTGASKLYYSKKIRFINR